MKLIENTDQGGNIEQYQAFSEKILFAGEKIGLSRKALEVLEEITNQSPDNLKHQALEKWEKGVKGEVIRCFIEASSIIRGRIHETGSLDALEKICEFLHVITGEDIYMFLMSMYRDREDHPSRINADTSEGIRMNIATSVNSDVIDVIKEEELAQAA